jgi:hypothetical protein
MNRVRATWFRLAAIVGMIAAVAIASGACNQW